MKFTLLGATGVIGRRLRVRLQAEGHDVHAPARGDSGIFERPLGHVIYAIGLTADFRSRPFATVEAHVSLLAEVLQRADFSSLLYLSSTRVYARSADRGREDAALPVLAHDPSDLYNLSKLLGESLCLSCGRANTRVARLSNVVGGDDAGSANFIPSLLRDALAGRIVLHTDPGSEKDYIHIDDVTDLLPRIALHGRERIYNVASGRQISHARWLERLQTLTGCQVEIAANAPPASFVPIDTSRLRAEFDLAPRDVLSSLPDMLAAMSSHHH